VSRALWVNRPLRSRLHASPSKSAVVGAVSYSWLAVEGMQNR